jgi:hypothetical protein
MEDCGRWLRAIRSMFKAEPKVWTILLCDPRAEVFAVQMTESEYADFGRRSLPFGYTLVSTRKRRAAAEIGKTMQEPNPADPR